MSDTESASAASSGVVITRHGPQVVEITLDRPRVLNAISTTLARELITIARELGRDHATRAVVVSSSSDRAFCAGADLKERADFSDDDLLAQRPVIRDLFAAIREMPTPTIAAVDGYAVGGGFELALSCDVIVASESATFGLTEVTVGLVPGGGGTQLLARRVGIGAAAEMILSGCKVDAKAAYRRGIADRLTPKGQARTVALELATTIAANSPVAVRAAKRALHAALGGDSKAGFDVEDAAWHAAAVSADRREGIRAFVEKRAPRWQGR